MKNKMIKGLLLIIAATTLLLMGLGIIAWSTNIIFSIVFTALAIYTLFIKKWFIAFVSLAFLINNNAKALGIDVSLWHLILAALLFSIGFKLLFNKNSHKGVFTIIIDDEEDHLDSESESYNLSSILGSKVHYIHSDILTVVNCSVELGNMEVFLNQAQLKNNLLVIDVDVNVGSLTLHIPKTWKVIDNVSCLLGDSTLSRNFEGTSENTVKIIGTTSLGSVEIKSI
ncbi:MAG: hypothetical protein ACK5G7_01250 [Erysipelotrichaceae bacterium]